MNSPHMIVTVKMNHLAARSSP